MRESGTKWIKRTWVLVLILVIGGLAVMFVVFRESSRMRLIEADADGTAPGRDSR